MRVQYYVCKYCAVQSARSERQAVRLTVIKYNALGVLRRDESGAARRVRWYRVVSYEKRAPQ